MRLASGVDPQPQMMARGEQAPGGLSHQILDQHTEHKDMLAKKRLQEGR